MFLINKSHLQEIILIIFVSDKEESLKRNNANMFYF